MNWNYRERLFLRGACGVHEFRNGKAEFTIDFEVTQQDVIRITSPKR
jgi:hypothetical protein